MAKVRRALYAMGAVALAVLTFATLTSAPTTVSNEQVDVAKIVLRTREGAAATFDASEYPQPQNPSEWISVYFGGEGSADEAILAEQGATVSDQQGSAVSDLFEYQEPADVNEWILIHFGGEGSPEAI